MLAKPFEKAVCVWVRLGFPLQLNTVIDAYQFVSECCGNSLEQKAAIYACKAAFGRGRRRRNRARCSRRSRSKEGHPR